MKTEKERLVFGDFKEILEKQLPKTMPKECKILISGPFLYAKMGNKETAKYRISDIHERYLNNYENKDITDPLKDSLIWTTNMLTKDFIQISKSQLMNLKPQKKQKDGPLPGSLEDIAKRKKKAEKIEFKHKLKSKLENAFDDFTIENGQIIIPVDEHPEWQAQLEYNISDLYDKYQEHCKNGVENPIKKIIKKIEKDYDEKCEELSNEREEREEEA